MVEVVRPDCAADLAEDRAGNARGSAVEPVEVVHADQWARTVWRLDPLAQDYGRFITLLYPLAEQLQRDTSAASRSRLSDQDAFVARIVAIHEFRRLRLRDPLLPPALLPTDWTGAAAWRSMTELYAATWAASERWLDAEVAASGDVLPPVTADAGRRFG
jgi:phenylacetic acid degradation operon negative regulatory protein